MNHLNLKASSTDRLIITLTLLVSLFSICFPNWINTYGVGLIALLIAFIGVPHGVADCLIFKYSKSSNSPHNKIKFYASYILLCLTSAFCLYASPNVTVIVFIMVSVYHLGQAHLFYLSIPENWLVKGTIYSFWGTFVIFAPIFSNAQEVTKICSEFLGSTWVISLLNQKYLMPGILILNLFILGFLVTWQYIPQQDWLKETLNLLVLVFLFYTSPLIISFGVYFTLWHSFGSTLEQIKFIRKYNSNFGLSTFYQHVIPLSLVLIFLFLVSQLLLSELVIQKNSLLTAISLFFSSLIVITLPHSIVRNQIYQKQN